MNELGGRNDSDLFTLIKGWSGGLPRMFDYISREVYIVRFWKEDWVATHCQDMKSLGGTTQKNIN